MSTSRSKGPSPSDQSISMKQPSHRTVSAMRSTSRRRNITVFPVCVVSDWDERLNSVVWTATPPGLRQRKEFTKNLSLRSIEPRCSIEQLDQQKSNVPWSKSSGIRFMFTCRNETLSRRTRHQGRHLSHSGHQDSRRALWFLPPFFSASSVARSDATTRQPSDANIAEERLLSDREPEPQLSRPEHVAFMQRLSRVGPFPVFSVRLRVQSHSPHPRVKTFGLKLFLDTKP